MGSVALCGLYLVEKMADDTQEWQRLAADYLKRQVEAGWGEIVMPQRTSDKSSDAAKRLDAIKAQVDGCERCPLHKGRKNTVFGEGAPEAEIMFVGEGPGAEEDQQGKPFVGKAGRLLTKMIAAMGLDRSQVYIANIVKSRPPRNRDPEPDEIEACMPFLEDQIDAIGPVVIVALGRVAAQTLLDTRRPISALRGHFHERRGIQVMPTYHPSFLLRDPDNRARKAEAWEDLKQVMELVGLRP